MSFQMNPYLARQLAAQAAQRRALEQIAGGVAGEVEPRAERRPIMPKGGRRRTVVVESDSEGVRVVLTGHGAHLEEFGSVNNPARAPLRRGVRAAGLRLDE